MSSNSENNATVFYVPDLDAFAKEWHEKMNQPVTGSETESENDHGVTLYLNGPKRDLSNPRKLHFDLPDLEPDSDEENSKESSSQQLSKLNNAGKLKVNFPDMLYEIPPPSKVFKKPLRCCDVCGHIITNDKKKVNICNICDSFRLWKWKHEKKMYDAYPKIDDKFWAYYSKNHNQVHLPKYKELRKCKKCQSCGEKTSICYVGKKVAAKEFVDANTIGCCKSCLMKKYPTLGH